MAIIRDPIDPTRILRVNADGSLTVLFGAGATVTLDASSLAALENITATVGGPIALDAASLAALESVSLNAATVDAITGTDGATPPGISGSGIRGWLRAIYERLVAGIGITGIVEVANDAGNPLPVNGEVAANITKVNGAAHGAGNPLFADMTDRIARILGTAKAQQDGSWTVALDAATLAALESISVQNFPANQAVSLASGPGTAPGTPIYAFERPADLKLKQVSAANTAQTLTIPASAGNFQYLVGILVQRYNSTATAVAGAAANLAVTTTNLGGLEFRFGNAVGAGAGDMPVNLQPSNPLKADTVNTATTIVVPALGAGIVSVVNVLYFLAP